ncbi:MAG: nucleotidyltransferase family protein [Bacteroidota bacterium]|nr:nucleotidyltransferase family protein [Bacteroidota bacterium]
MKSRNEIELLLKQHKKELESIFFIKEIGLFGSFVRNEQNERSDVDILVEFNKPVGMFHFLGLEKRLAEILGCRIDLVTKKSLKPFIGRQILSEVIYL